MENTTNWKQRLPIVSAIIGLMVVLDQWTKHWAANKFTLDHIPDEKYWDGFFSFNLVHNPGAFLSLGANFPDWLRMLLLNIFPAILLVGMLIYILRSTSLDKWMIIGLSMIVGGGLSNIVDRIWSGYVVDFMHMKVFGLQTGIFNVADLAIVFGMIFLIPSMFKGDPKKEDVALAEEADGGED